MKKLSLFIVSILLLVPISVFAAEYKVETLEAKANGSTINYNGTMEDGSTAVMCKLKNSKDEEVDLLSSAVDSNKFEGSFEGVAKGDYKVVCANYEGGEIKEVEVTVETETIDSVVTSTTSKKSSKSPKTGDSITKYIILVVLAIVGIGYSVFKLKKGNKKRLN